MCTNRNKTALEILHKGTVIPATPLMLNSDRKFDPAMQERLTRYYLEAGVGGIATAVHTTQFEIRLPHINLYETVISSVIDTINKYEEETGKTIVKVAGVCGDMSSAEREANIAKKLGFDAVLLSTGGLDHWSEDELIERAKMVAGIIPVILFSMQTAVGGRKFSYSYWEKTAEIDGVVAVKCASFNRYQTHDIVRAMTLSSRADRIALYTGNDDNIVIDLATEYTFENNGEVKKARIVGGLLGHWCAWTKKAVEIFDGIKSGGIRGEALLSLAAAVTDTNSAFFDTANNFAGCIAGVHEVLRRQGFVDGIYLLNPNEKLSDGQFEEIDRVYRMYPELNDDSFAKEFIANYKA